MKNPVKKIAIVGRDADAWITALLLKSGMTGSDIDTEIEVIEQSSQLTPHDFYSVLPSHRGLHKALGANEEKLNETSKAHFCFGQRFSNWNDDLPAYIHAYDGYGVDFDNVSFYQYWLKAKRSGLNVPLEDFSLGAAIAKQGKFIANNAAKPSFSHATYGFHLSAKPYVIAVAKAALAAGVTHRVSEIKSISHENHNISSIELVDGSEVFADLFIDATGSEAKLISSFKENNFDSWSQWFHCDRMIVASGPAFDSAPAFSQITAFPEGWAGFYPLQDRTGINILFSSKHISGADALHKVSAISGLPIHNAIERPFISGTMKESWIGNCVAVGTASTNMEPLDALQLQPLIISLTLLRELFPNNKDEMPEASIFNTKIRSFMENLRNFQISHYLLNNRLKDSFWNDCRNSVPPAELAEKLALFKHRGLTSIRENETFQEENWICVFNGHGAQPDRYDSLADAIPDEDLMQKFQSILHIIKQVVEQLPTLKSVSNKG